MLVIYKEKGNFYLTVDGIVGVISQDTRNTTVRRQCNLIYVGCRDRNLTLEGRI